MENNLFYVYKHLDKYENILYVGYTQCIKTRTKSHYSAAKWFSDVSTITYKTYSSKEEAMQQEIDLIKKYNPLFNRIHNQENTGEVFFKFKDSENIELLGNMRIKLEEIQAKTGIKSIDDVIRMMINLGINDFNKNLK